MSFKTAVKIDFWNKFSYAWKNDRVHLDPFLSPDFLRGISSVLDEFTGVEVVVIPMPDHPQPGVNSYKTYRNVRRKLVRELLTRPSPPGKPLSVDATATIPNEERERSIAMVFPRAGHMDLPGSLSRHHGLFVRERLGGPEVVVCRTESAEVVLERAQGLLDSYGAPSPHDPLWRLWVSYLAAVVQHLSRFRAKVVTAGDLESALDARLFWGDFTSPSLPWAPKRAFENSTEETGLQEDSKTKIRNSESENRNSDSEKPEFEKPDSKSEIRKAKWDYRHLGLAKHVAMWSKDPSTKVGAVIARPDKTIASLGFNGFPRGVEDHDHRLNDRNEKYPRVVHAEMNAILNAKDPSLEGYTLYTWPFPPCARCAAHVIQARIKRVVCPRQAPERWCDDIRVAYDMFSEAGVRVEHIDDLESEEE